MTNHLEDFGLPCLSLKFICSSLAFPTILFSSMIISHRFLRSNCEACNLVRLILGNVVFLDHCQKDFLQNLLLTVPPDDCSLLNIMLYNLVECHRVGFGF